MNLGWKRDLASRDLSYRRQRVKTETMISLRSASQVGIGVRIASGLPVLIRYAAIPAVNATIEESRLSRQDL